MKQHVLSLSFFGLVAACSSASSEPQVAATPAPSATEPVEPPPAAEPVEGRLARFLSGTFDSKDQAKADSSYFAISLKVCKALAPELGERVLYVEQARMGSAPYRQRIYIVERVDDTTARSRVLELADPSALTGACDEDQPRTIALKQTVERPGCWVDLHLVGDKFFGHTPDAKWNGETFEKDPKGEKCGSDFQGATYASSEVTLDAAGLVSWDRGYDAADEQVWGATAGGYRFVRRSALAEP